jgi:hypothetical protein
VGLSWAVHGDGSIGRLGRFQSEFRLGRVKNRKKGEGIEEAGWAGLAFQLGFGLLPNRN